MCNQGVQRIIVIVGFFGSLVGFKSNLDFIGILGFRINLVVGFVVTVATGFASLTFLSIANMVASSQQFDTRLDAQTKQVNKVNISSIE